MKHTLLFTLISVLFTLTGNAQMVYEDFNQNRLVDYFFTSGVFIEYEANPGPSTANNSPTVGRYVRNPAETFDVIVMDLSNMQDLGDYLNGTKQISLDVYSPAPGITVQVTLEDTNTATSTNFPVGRHSVYLGTTTTTNAWETITLSFDNQPDNSVANTDVERFVLLFNPNSNTDDTYFFDNVNGPELQNNPCGGVTADPFIFNDFECQQNVDYTFKHGFMARRPNPDPSGFNTSDYVVQYDRNAGELDDVIVGSFSGPLDLTVNNQLQFQVYDSDAKSVIELSLQNGAGNDIMTLKDSTGSSNTWETMVYDFSAISAATDVEQFVILYKRGTASFATVYFDNFEAVEPDPIGISENNENTLGMEIYPNPTQGLTNLRYELDRPGQVTLSVHDITGREMIQLNQNNQSAGQQQMTFDASQLPAGVFLVTLQTENAVQSLRFYHLP